MGNFLIALTFGAAVAALVAVAYFAAVRRMAGMQPGEEALEAAIAKLERLGFRVEKPVGVDPPAPWPRTPPAVDPDQPATASDGVVSSSSPATP